MTEEKLPWRKVKREDVPDEIREWVDAREGKETDVYSLAIGPNNDAEFFAIRKDNGPRKFFDVGYRFYSRIGVRRETGKPIPDTITLEALTLAQAPAPWETLAILAGYSNLADRPDYPEIFEGLRQLEAKSAAIPEPPVLVYHPETFRDQSALVVDVEKRHETSPGVYRIPTGRGYLSVDITKSEDAGGPVILGALIEKTLMLLYSRVWSCHNFWGHESPWGIVSVRRFADRLGTKPDQMKRAVTTLTAARFVQAVGTKTRTVQTPIPTAYFFDSPDGEPEDQIIVYRVNEDFWRQLGVDWILGRFDRDKASGGYVSIPRSWGYGELTTQQTRFRDWLRLLPNGQRTVTLYQLLVEIAGYSEARLDTKKRRKAAVETLFAGVKPLNMLAVMPGGALYRVAVWKTPRKTDVVFVKGLLRAEKTPAASQGKPRPPRREDPKKPRAKSSAPTESKPNPDLVKLAGENRKARQAAAEKKTPGRLSPAEEKARRAELRRQAAQLAGKETPTDPPAGPDPEAASE